VLRRGNPVDGLLGGPGDRLPEHAAVEHVDLGGLGVERHRILGAFIDDRGIGRSQHETIGQFGDVHDDRAFDEPSRVAATTASSQGPCITTLVPSRT